MKSFLLITLFVYLSFSALVYVPSTATNSLGYTDCYFCVLSGGKFCASTSSGTSSIRLNCATAYTDAECTAASVFTTLT